jgi:hypothetical protein
MPLYPQFVALDGQGLFLIDDGEAPVPASPR